MSVKSTLLVLSFGIASGVCVAQDLEKDGLPCVAEICVGDGLSELSKIQWDRSKNPFSPPNKPIYTSTRKVSDIEMRNIRKNFRGDVTKAAAYIGSNVFDSIALPALAKVTAACTPSDLTGTFTSNGGNPTRVTIALIPRSQDNTKQQWTVVSIARNFPKAVTEVQKAEVETELVKRYFKYGAKNPGIKNAKPGEARFWGNFGSDFGFSLTMFQGLEMRDRLNSHPLCGGTAKVSVD